MSNKIAHRGDWTHCAGMLGAMAIRMCRNGGLRMGGGVYSRVTERTCQGIRLVGRRTMRGARRRLLLLVRIMQRGKSTQMGDTIEGVIGRRNVDGLAIDAVELEVILIHGLETRSGLELFERERSPYSGLVGGQEWR